MTFFRGKSRRVKESLARVESEDSPIRDFEYDRITFIVRRCESSEQVESRRFIQEIDSEKFHWEIRQFDSCWK